MPNLAHFCNQNKLNSKLSAQIAGNGVSGGLLFKISRGRMPPDPFTELAPSALVCSAPQLLIRSYASDCEAIFPTPFSMFPIYYKKVIKTASYTYIHPSPVTAKLFLLRSLIVRFSLHHHQNQGAVQQYSRTLQESV